MSEKPPAHTLSIKAAEPWDAVFATPDGAAELAVERGKVVAAEALTETSEEIYRELVCGCVEEFGERDFIKGRHHVPCWYAHLAATIVRKHATRWATS